VISSAKLGTSELSAYIAGRALRISVESFFARPWQPETKILSTFLVRIKLIASIYQVQLL